MNIYKLVDRYGERSKEYDERQVYYKIKGSGFNTTLDWIIKDEEARNIIPIIGPRNTSSGMYFIFRRENNLMYLNFDDLSIKTVMKDISNFFRISPYSRVGNFEKDNQKYYITNDIGPVLDNGLELIRSSLGWNYYNKSDNVLYDLEGKEFYRVKEKGQPYNLIRLNGEIIERENGCRDLKDHFIERDNRSNDLVIYSKKTMEPLLRISGKNFRYLVFETAIYNGRTFAVVSKIPEDITESFNFSNLFYIPKSRTVVETYEIRESEVILTGRLGGQK